MVWLKLEGCLIALSSFVCLSLLVETDAQANVSIYRIGLKLEKFSIALYRLFWLLLLLVSIAQVDVGICIFRPKL